jgi:hypothetical protein
MKYIGTLAVLGAVLAASAPFASADSINLGSYGTCTNASSPGCTAASAMGNNNSALVLVGTQLTGSTEPPSGVEVNPTTGGSANTYDIPANSPWEAALTSPTLSSWVGINANAAPGGPNVPYGYYTFATTFTSVSGGLYTGSLDVQADDTLEVFLNGSLTPLINFGAFAPPANDITCASSIPNCTGQDTINLNLNLVAGATNTLYFVVEQAGSQTSPNIDPSGLDFSGSLTAAAAPEPDSLVLLGTGLLSAAGMLIRKRRTV